MYLRHTTVRKDGKVHKYWRLVQSVRVGRRVIQRTVAQLGELDHRGRVAARRLAHSIVGSPEQVDLFDDGYSDVVVPIKLKGVRVERSKRFGDVYMALALWRALKFDEFCMEETDGGRRGVPLGKTAAVLACARLCEPSSELHIAEDWYRRTALSDLIQLSDEQVNKDRLYRALDEIMMYKESLEAHLTRRAGELFERSNDVLLYDMTSTYFEGEAAANPKARRGYSRDHRPDCRQVCIALVVTFDGFPLGYEVFSGNTHDSTTVRQIVNTMEKRHGAIGRVWVMDRGMVSADNIEWFKETGRRYIIGTPKAEMKKWAVELSERKDWRRIRNDIEVKLCREHENGDEIYILCRSQARMEKEKAIHERFSERILKALTKLQNRVARARKRMNRDAVNRQIGRILQVNQRAAARFSIELFEDDIPAGFRVEVSVNEDFDNWADISEGAYVLRTNVTDWDDERLWKTYIQLTQAEAAFRIQKKELSIRPIWHQREDRVEAHIFVCFLAFAMWKTLENWQSRAGLGNSPRTILEELSRIQSHDVILPTNKGFDIRLRCIAQPDRAQSVILERLGLALPKRMKIPEMQDCYCKTKGEYSKEDCKCN